MKIVSWNVNGYRSIVGQNPTKKYDKIGKRNYLNEFIERENPDILCLQEIKASLEQIDENYRCPKPFETCLYNEATSKKGYSGVATFSKIPPLAVNKTLGKEIYDVEGRFIETKFERFVLFNVYFPKGYADSERLDYKLDFYDFFFEILKETLKKEKNAIIAGDFNTAHKEIDLARPKQNVKTSGFMPVERKKLDELVDLGFIDAFREFVKEGGHYTWWSQRGRARENNVGWRIDYFFVSRSLRKALKSVRHAPDAIGSDHCPVILEVEF